MFQQEKEKTIPLWAKCVIVGGWGQCVVSYVPVYPIKNWTKVLLSELNFPYCQNSPKMQSDWKEGVKWTPTMGGGDTQFQDWG